MTGPLTALDDKTNRDENTHDLEMPSPNCQQCQNLPVAGAKTNLCQHCQATITASIQNQESPNRAELALLVSPFRPFPREARRKLRQCAETVVFDDSMDEYEDIAYLTELPADDLLEEFELSVPRDPEERWRDETGTCVNIYPTRVMVNGHEQTLDPADAQARVRAEDRFTPLPPASESGPDNSSADRPHPSESHP